MKTDAKEYQITAKCSVCPRERWLKINIGDWRVDNLIDMIYKIYDSAPDSLTLAEYFTLENLTKALGNIQTESEEV